VNNPDLAKEIYSRTQNGGAVSAVVRRKKMRIQIASLAEKWVGGKMERPFVALSNLGEYQKGSASEWKNQL